MSQTNTHVIRVMDELVRAGIFKRRKDEYALTDRFLKNNLELGRKYLKTKTKAQLRKEGIRRSIDNILLASLSKQFGPKEKGILTTSFFITKLTMEKCLPKKYKNFFKL